MTLFSPIRVAVLSAFAASSLAIGQADAAGSADSRAGLGIEIAPTKVEIGAGERGAELQIANPRDRTIRYRVRARAWSQNPRGEMLLDETDELRAYPHHLELAPGDRALVRLLADSNGADVEQSYRIVLEEVSSEGERQSDAPRLRVAIPVFLAPEEPRTNVRIRSVRAEGERIFFDLQNVGTTHALPREAAVLVKDERGAKAARESQPGWYLLPSDRLRYAISLPDEICDRARANGDYEVKIVALGEDGTTPLAERAATQACAPAEPARP